LSAVRVATLKKGENEDDDHGHKGGVLSVVFHPTALVLATGSDDKTAKLWRLSSDDLSTEFFVPKRNMYTKCACVCTLKGHREYVTCVAFHPNEPILATGSRDHTVKLWRLSSDYHSETSVATLEGFRVGHSDYVRSVAFHPTGHLFATCSDDKTVKLWRLSPDNLSATCVATLEGHSDYVTSVAFHPSAPRLATSSRDFTVKLWHYCFKSC
jgi:WD40 repeat protein